MQTISSGKRVALRIELKVQGGQVLEKSDVEYFQGAGTMLPALEAALEGLVAGNRKTGVLAAAEAFGAPEHQHMKIITRSEFPADISLAPGARMVARGPGGLNVVLEVQSFDDTRVVTKMKHPLAEKNLEYDATILSVSDPAPPPMPAAAIAQTDE